MKKYCTFIPFFVLLLIILASSKSNSKEAISHTSEDGNYDPYEGIIYSLHSSPNNEYDNFATIEDYSNAKSVKDGVFIIPYEIKHEGIIYPVAGVNTYGAPKHIKEVIIPREFGAKK